MPSPIPPRVAFYALFTASGFAGLIYESIWTHYLRLFLGHAAYAQSLVLIVFMGGLACGSALLGSISARLRNPLGAYALVEAVIGALALGFHEEFVALTDWSYATLLPALGSESLVLAAKLGVSCLLILPQSILLGMTFPLMSAGLVRAQPSSSGEAIGMLYFTNSLGAAVGVLASGFLLIEWVGLPGTLRTAAGINLVLAAVVWWLARPIRHPAIARQFGALAEGAALLYLVALLTGLASFIYEISWIRMLSLVLGASTHSFELMLSVFILGLALGGFAIRRHVDAAASPERLLGWVQVLMALAALSTLLAYDATFGVMEWMMKGLSRTEAGYLFFNLSGQAISAVVMLPATFCAGMTLPLITGALLRAGAGEAAIGKVYAANTVGAIGGVLAAVHLGLPLLGLKATLIAGAAVDAVAGLALLYRYAALKRSFALALGGCAAVFVPVSAAFELDANKMTAGVFRHADLASSRDAKILFRKDGKTATVHLVQYPEAVSIRTNGKSDGSINLKPEGERGSDEITMVLTGAVPLALKPGTKTAAVIGIGTALTMHTLLQSMALERVETVEIESAMAEASRGFLPRNAAAFADPRGSILIDDAKTFFASHRRRYDLIISEPSNPWVSGVSSLFTREFYRRIRTHLNRGGLLVQWFQLYEIDPSLVGSVLAALAEEFAQYAVFAPSDHDLLIVASEAPIPLPANEKVFNEPLLARELRTVHVLRVGDLDARYLGSRATLEPLFASYGMAANSDYYPVLDLNAAKHRFMEKSATDIVAMLNAGVPVLEMLEPQRASRPLNPQFKGAYSFDRIDNARLARYARDFLLDAEPPEPFGVPTQLEKDVELVRVRLIECRQPRELDIWLHALVHVAKAVNPFLPAEEANEIWGRIAGAPCHEGLQDFQKRWIALFAAVGARDAVHMAELAADLLATQAELNFEAREYLLMAGMTGYLAAGSPQHARTLWAYHSARIARNAGKPIFRLLRCHASAGTGEDCAQVFRTQNAAQN